MKLSLAMILRNEGKTIYRCLDSMKEFVDEWIIGIDDQTNDNTEDEVKKFFQNFKKEERYPNFVNIYKYKWNDSFSKARNEGMDKATGDWILIMDGHEYFPVEWYEITSGKRIKVIEVIKQVKKQLETELADEVFFHLYQQPFIGETPNNYFLQPRIYRNGVKREYEKKKEGKINKPCKVIKELKGKPLRFNRAAHNTILNTDPDAHIHYPEVIIIHDAPDENRKERSLQRIRINTKALKDDLKKNPKDTRAMFYLGNTLLEAKKWKEAIKQYDDYLKYRADDNSEKYQALLHKALCLKELKEWDQMALSLHYAVKVNNLRRDAFCLLGELYYSNKEFERALGYYNQALSIKSNPSRMFNNGPVYTWQPHQNLARVYEELGDKQRAVAHYKQALKYVTNKHWIERIKELSGDKKNILIVDSIGSFTKDFNDFLLKKGYNVMKTKGFDPALASWADYIWQEWADNNAIQSSQWAGKTTIRIHGYEAYLNKRLFNQINWSNKVVFVAKHIKDMMNSYVNGNGIVIQNGVDCDKFYIKTDKRDPHNIGYAGYINEKKNPYLLIKIIKKNKGFKFHLRIDHQSPFWEETFKYELRNCKNVVYHGRYKDLNDFWNQMGGVLSTSIIESFSYNVAEAMACGCRPYIYDWRGARDIWNEKFIYTEMPGLKHKLTFEDMQGYRKYIIDNYELSKSLKEMERVLVS